MSALLPKADIRRYRWNFHFVPTTEAGCLSRAVGGLYLRHICRLQYLPPLILRLLRRLDFDRAAKGESHHAANFWALESLLARALSRAMTPWTLVGLSLFPV
jgi:hypothetical protein